MIFLFDRAERLVPNIELETFDYTGRNMKKKSPSVAKEEEAKAIVEDPKEVNEAELEGLCQKFSRMRSTEKSSLIQVKPTPSPKTATFFRISRWRLKRTKSTSATFQVR